MVRRTVLHFLRGYLAFLAGMLVLLVPFYGATISMFETRQLALTGETLRGGLNRLDQQITALSGLAFSIGDEPSYRTLALRDAEALSPADYYSLNALHTQFRRLCLSQPYVTDYGLLLRNHILFTKERVHMEGDGFYGDFAAFGDMDEQAFYRAFGSPAGVSQYLGELLVRMRHDDRLDEYDAVVWLGSMSQIHTQRPSGVFYATIACDTLAELLMPGMSAEEAGFCLSTRGGETLATYGLAKAAPDNARRLSCTAQQTGLTVTLLLSDTLFTGMMAPIRNLLLYCVLGLVLVGVVLAGWLASRASRPIGRLVKLVSDSENAASYQGDAKNGFELIGNAVTGLSSSVDEYRRALVAQQASVREHVFETLLHETPYPGGAASERHLQEFARCFPAFPARYRLALLLLADESDGVDSLPKRQIALRGLIEASLSPAPYVFISGRRAVLTLDDARGEDWAEPLAELRRTAQARFGLRLSAALSDPGEAPTRLHALYQQARNILRLADGEDGPVEVWQRRNFPDQQESFPLDYTEMAQLHTLLLRGEKSAALSLLRMIRDNLRPASFLDEVMARQVFYNIRGVLLRVKMERYATLDALDVPDYHGEIGDDRLFELLESCCETICDALAPLARMPQTAFSSAVCRFIDEHLGDSALCARMVADRFAISEPTLQKVVRQEKRCSFFEYVEHSRHTLAISLLRESDLPIATIAARCGYNSPNSFYKAFHRLSAVPPAAVRQEAKAGALGGDGPSQRR